MTAPEDPMAALLRRDLLASTVEFDADRADAMIREATAAELRATPRWVAPAAAAAAVLVVSGGVAVYASSGTSDDVRPAGPAAEPPACAGLPTASATPSPARSATGSVTDSSAPTTSESRSSISLGAPRRRGKVLYPTPPSSTPGTRTADSSTSAPSSDSSAVPCGPASSSAPSSAPGSVLPSVPGLGSVSCRETKNRVVCGPLSVSKDCKSGSGGAIRRAVLLDTADGRTRYRLVYSCGADGSLHPKLIEVRGN